MKISIDGASPATTSPIVNARRLASSTPIRGWMYWSAIDTARSSCATRTMTAYPCHVRSITGRTDRRCPDRPDPFAGIQGSKVAHDAQAPADYALETNQRVTL